MMITGRGTRTHAFSAAARRREAGRGGRAALAAYGALAAVDLLATARAPRGPRRAAKPLLMPALASYASKRGGRDGDGARTSLPAPMAAGLACATVGDTALLFDGKEPAFLLGMAAFLGTQVSYTAGLARLTGVGADTGTAPTRRRVARTAVGTLAAWAAVNAALAPTLERRLRLPVAGYSLALAAMGGTALVVGGTVAAGAGAFLASDLLIGLQAAGHEFPSQEVLIMAGYLLGQYLLVTGWLDRAAVPARTAAQARTEGPRPAA